MHTLFNLDPDEQGATTLMCNDTGTARLHLDGGMWRVDDTGQNFHVSNGGVFACGDDGTASTLTVIDGTVELTSLTTGAVQQVTTGQLVVTDATGLSAPQSFDVAAANPPPDPTPPPPASEHAPRHGLSSSRIAGDVSSSPGAHGMDP